MHLEKIITPEEQQEFESIMLNRLISLKETFVFVATPASMKNKDRFYHCSIAAKFHKTMYAYVKKGIIARIYWRRYRDFPWKRVYIFKTKQDLDFAMHEIMMLMKRQTRKETKNKKDGNIGYA